MDWFSWLSKSPLEPTLVYEYGLVFSRNELQFEDVSYFNHEFLQSMGISVAKHRLEILKLATKHNGEVPGKLSGLALAINRTKKCLNKYISKWVFPGNMPFKAAPSPLQYREHWRGDLLRRYKSEETTEERPVLKKRTITLSGPLYGRLQEKVAVDTRNLRLSGPQNGRLQEVMVNTKNLGFSGPLDRKVHEETLFTATSPRLSGPLDRRIHEKIMYRAKSPKLPGALEDWTPVRSIVTTKSPKLPVALNERVERSIVNGTCQGSSGSIDGKVAMPIVCSDYKHEKKDVDYDDHSLWAALFHDMKPT